MNDFFCGSFYFISSGGTELIQRLSMPSTTSPSYSSSTSSLSSASSAAS